MKLTAYAAVVVAGICPVAAAAVVAANTVGNAKLGTEAIDRVLQTYLAYIDPELADVVRKIRKSHYLFRMRDNGHCYPLGRAEEIRKVDTPHGAEEYEEFWTLMRLAESKLK